MNIKNEIKSILAKEGISMTYLNDELNKKHNSSNTVQNLANKLYRGTIRYREILDIADIIGYEIKWTKKD